jgi:hypothetical protein
MVIQRLCPRCRTVVHIEDDNSLVFCSNCGAPQVRLSQELLEAQVEATAQLPEGAPVSMDATAAATQNTVVPALNRWSGAVQCAGIAGAVAAGLTLISFAVPALGLLSMGWVVAAPIVVLGVYASRFRNTRITAGFAARLGLLCGVAILVAMLALNTIHLCLDRFVFHAATAIDSQLATTFAQQEAVLSTQLGTDAAPMLHTLAIPEFRAGILLCSFGMLSALYLVYSAAAGAFAGLLRSRTSTR